METVSAHALSPLAADREELLAETGRIAREDLRPVAEADEPGRVNRPLVQALGAVARELYR
jgi:hypothetical protein